MVDKEAALVQLKLQLESLISIAKNCLATAKLLDVGPSTIGPTIEAPSRGRPGLITDQVLAEMPAALRSKLTAVLTSYGSVVITKPWMDPEDFAAVNEMVEALGGKWIPEGKRSRWEIPVPAT